MKGESLMVVPETADGISDTVNKLVRSYLVNRHQRVSVKDIRLNEVSSKWEHDKHGVPQRSILGPIPFLIKINDFPLTINKIIHPVFAEGTSIIISNTYPEEFKSNISSVLNETIN
jgi:hypothetical protein